VIKSGRVRIFLAIAAGVLAGLSLIVSIIVLRFAPVARSYVITSLRQRYKSDVELGNFQISLFPVVHATGDNLVLRLSGRTDIPPIIRVRRFTIEAAFVGFFRHPKQIQRVTLEGLELHIPPKSERPQTSSGAGSENLPFVLDEVVANGAVLETLPSDPKKEPLRFDISELDLKTVGRGMPMKFRAVLTNPKPPGLIHSNGKFGPWNPDEPADTPVSGDYTFANADLSVFHGIKGILSSTGSYGGALDRIEVAGSTDVPDFALSTGNHPTHLTTQFAATVDGTNGDTILHPVHAMMGKSWFEVSGSIERNALEMHKEIDLDASSTRSEIADFLRLAMKSNQPPMTGRLVFKSKVKIPPGKTPVAERLQLDGTFELGGVRFTSADVQGKIASLSHHAQGYPQATEVNDVAADINGQFHLRAAVMQLPQLRFTVPGALISLKGQYGLASSEIDLTGTARLDATVSQMTTGWKHVLLKPVDPLFRHDGAGTVLPINISGTRGSPTFKIDIGRVLRRESSSERSAGR
jgi:hypothetical protein